MLIAIHVHFLVLHKTIFSYMPAGDIEAYTEGIVAVFIII